MTYLFPNTINPGHGPNRLLVVERYTFAFSSASRQKSKAEKLEILKYIDRYENFGEVFKRDITLLQESGLLGQKVKENVLLTKEFYDGIEIDRLFGTLETTSDLIGIVQIMPRRDFLSN